jgi:hypothetical protein
LGIEVPTEVPTYIGNIGCANDGKVFMQINFELDGKPALLTVSMSNIKAEEVAKTLEKSVTQGQKWLETGVPP